MKKSIFLIPLLIIVMLLCGCGNSGTETEVSEVDEMSEMDEMVNDYPEDIAKYIDDYVSGDFNGKFTVNVNINHAGHMAEVADYITQSVSQLSG